MKRLIVVSTLVFVVIGLAYAQTRPERPSGLGTPHYQLVAATAGYEAKDGGYAHGPEVFLLDTETGRVWKYEFSRDATKPDGTVDDKLPGVLAHFDLVPADGLNGWYLLRYLEKVHGKNQK